MATLIWAAAADGANFGTDTNWSPNAVPANNDTLVFNGTSTKTCTAGLDQSALTGVTLVIEKSYTGQIGSVSGGVATPLKFGTATVKLPRSSGAGSPSGSPRLIFGTTGSAGGTLLVEDTCGSSSETAYPPVQIVLGTWTASISGGGLGVAFAPRFGETCTVQTLTTGKGQSGEPVIYLGPGSTVTSGTYDAGRILDASANAMTTVRISGASYEELGLASGAKTTVYLDAGKMYGNGSGTWTTCEVRGAEMHFEGLTQAKTVTTMKCFSGYSLNIDNGIPTTASGGLTITNAIEFADGVQSGSLTTPAGVKATLDNI